MSRARAAYAEAIRAQGPAWHKAADSVAAGYSNVWIEAALRTIEAALRLIPDETDL